MDEIDIRSLGGAKYFLLFKNDFTHYRTVNFVKTKDKTTTKLDLFLKIVENQFDRKVKSLRSDNGTEIKTLDTKKLLDSLRVFHIKSNAYTPEQNGRIDKKCVQLSRQLELQYRQRFK